MPNACRLRISSAPAADSSRSTSSLSAAPAARASADAPGRGDHTIGRSGEHGLRSRGIPVDDDSAKNGRSRSATRWVSAAPAAS